MTVVAERVMPRYAAELSPAPSPFARARKAIDAASTTVREHVQERYLDFREPLRSRFQTTGEIFQGVKTPEERHESAARMWRAVADESSNELNGLVVAGGAMAGINNAVELEVLRETDNLRKFDVVVTDSAGTGNFLCALAAPHITSDLYLDLAKTGFIRKRPGGMQLRRLMHKLMDNVDLEKIQEGPDWFIGITDEFGHKQLVDAKKQTPRNLFGAVYASMAAPLLFNERVLMDDGPRIDSSVSGLATEELLKFGVKNVCVLLNDTEEDLANLDRAPLKENLALRAAMWWGGYSRALTQATIDRRKALKRSLTLLDHNPNINVDIVIAPHGMNWITPDVKTLREIRDMTREDFEERLRRFGVIKDTTTTAPMLV